MAEIPKVVFERLRRAEGGAHLDADLLTAFAEHALPAAEREMVLGHLATCAECREVLALSAVESPAAALSPERPRHFFGLVPRHAFMLASAVVACVVVVAVVSVPNLMRQRQPAFETMDESRPLPPAPPAAFAELKQQAPAEAQTASGDEDKLAGKKEAGRFDRRAEAKGQSLESKSKLADMVEKQAPTTPAAVLAKRDGPRSEVGGLAGGALSVAAPRANEAVAVTGAAGPTDQSAPAQQSRKAEKDSLLLEAEGAAAPAKAREQSAEAHAESRMLHSPVSPPRLGTAGLYAAPAKWRISGAGQLERSSDGGRNWTVTHLPGDPKLRALATVGTAVWAGGGGGAIFHSSDGREFTRQPLPTEPVAPGEIVRIEFKDAQRGRASDSAGHAWTTEDGGRTWRFLK